MNVHKRFGAEGAHGLGGGMVSAASQQNLQKAEDLCRKGRPMDAVPFLREALKDANNLDADIQMAFLSPDKPTAVEVLEDAEVKGRAIMKRRLGPDAFSDDGPHVGKFGMILDTRPYMRVLQALVRMYFETGKYTRSAETMIEMLRLCPGDNMNQRSWLGSMLIRVGRYADALYFAQVWIDSTEGDGTPPRGGTVFKAPSRELFSAAREKSLSDPFWSPAVLLHTCALAAFHLWGACPQAAQYLRIAARANPHILSKILGRRSQPDGLNMHARGINGPEEAQDYRWLTQDLWTEAHAWGWITSDATLNGELLKICSHPDCAAQETKPTQFKQCAACHQVTYCGQPCQKADWKRHKHECQEHQEMKKTIKDFEKSKPNTTNVPIFSADLAAGMGPVTYDGTKFL
ncbi:hypothetical protein FB451DRAFT_1336012 [Mycena latifolia]|nr:hypothetical protein FB451DRAFT_1336012 [Mycena latifolia]